MSKNFKNPWAEGGEYYPDWLGGEKVLGETVLSNESNTLKVYSGIFDKNGKRISENTVRKPQEMLLLFTTSVENVFNGEEHLSFFDFNNKYQNVAQNVRSTYNQ